MKRALLAVLVLAGAALLGFALYRHTQAVRDVIPEPAPAAASVAPRSGFPLQLHKTPRAVPEIRFQDGAGRPMRLADFRGRTVLLNIWATWCPPCRKEMPSLDRLQKKLGGPDFEVVALSIDHEGASVVRRFYQELGIQALRIYIDPTTDVAGRLGIAGIPGTLLLDRDGKEIGRALGPAEWDSPEAIALIRQAVGRGAGPVAGSPPGTERPTDTRVAR